MNILITGASRGIGLNIAKIFKDKGHDLYLVNRSETEESQQLSDHILSDIDVANQAFDEKIRDFISTLPLDLIIHNAGVMFPQSLDNCSPQEVLQQFEVNALAPLRLTLALRDKLKKDSKVIFITSRMGSIADNNSGGSYGYRMSKAALNAAAKSLALDLKPQGITVGLIHPGWVQTRMTNQTGQLTPEESAQNIVARINAFNIDKTGQFFHCNGEPLPW